MKNIANCDKLRELQSFVNRWLFWMHYASDLWAIMGFEADSTSICVL